MFSRISFVALAVSLSACGGPGHVSLQYAHDYGFAVQDSIFMPFKDEAGRVVGAELVIADKPDLCRSMMSGRQPSQMRAVVIDIYRTSNSEYLAPDAEKYFVTDLPLPLEDSRRAIGRLVKTDLNCKDNPYGQEGELGNGRLELHEISSAVDGLVSGMFETDSPEHGKVAGTFGAEYCEVVATTPRCD